VQEIPVRPDLCAQTATAVSARADSGALRRRG
jgi:hypothetical protein